MRFVTQPWFHSLCLLLFNSALICACCISSFILKGSLDYSNLLAITHLPQFGISHTYISFYNTSYNRGPMSTSACCCSKKRISRTYAYSPNAPLTFQSGCCKLITNENNNHKHIVQIKDRLSEHFALHFIIFKVCSSVRHKLILRRNKDHKKPKRWAAADKHNRQTVGTQSSYECPRGFIAKKEKEKGCTISTEVVFVVSCWTSP